MENDKILIDFWFAKHYLILASIFFFTMKEGEGIAKNDSIDYKFFISLATNALLCEDFQWKSSTEHKCRSITVFCCSFINSRILWCFPVTRDFIKLRKFYLMRLSMCKMCFHGEEICGNDAGSCSTFLTHKKKFLLFLKGFPVCYKIYYSLINSFSLALFEYWFLSRLEHALCVLFAFPSELLTIRSLISSKVFPSSSLFSFIKKLKQLDS